LLTYNTLDYISEYLGYKAAGAPGLRPSNELRLEGSVGCAAVCPSVQCA
jgi:hypothetical protein